jgi:hypothetical protein
LAVSQLRAEIQDATNRWLAAGNVVSRTNHARSHFKCPACSFRISLTGAMLREFGIPSCRRCGGGKMRPG